ncbi:MAG: glycerate kinase [Candidatus Latescibacterota bacterium]
MGLPPDAVQRRAQARQIFAAGLAAADPQRCVERVLSAEEGGVRVAGDLYPLSAGARLVVVGAGKASPAMAAAAERILAERITAGAINTKYGHVLPLQRIAVTECGHPVPDQAGVEGTQRILALLDGLGPADLVLCLLSGGGSALLPAPASGLTLADKQQTTQELLACGATIGELNAVRKHLSRVKGGLLARHAQPARTVTLALSDVIGDPLDTIASGPTHPDSSTYAQCLQIADRYGVRARLPAAARLRLEAGAGGQVAETPKEEDPCFARAVTRVVGNNALAVTAAQERARVLGYHPLVLSSRIQGEARHVAAVLVAVAQEIASRDRPAARPACIICGGETTVTLQGAGRGGRNQELALAAALHLEGWGSITLLSAGTDGTDGPTDAAGAVADAYTVARGRARGLEAAQFLARNDSYPFLQALDDLVVTGPTGTNVMDLQVVLVD